MSDEMHAIHGDPPKARKKRTAVKKKPQGRKTAILFAVSLVLAVANLLLFVKLGIYLR